MEIADEHDPEQDGKRYPAERLAEPNGLWVIEEGRSFQRKNSAVELLPDPLRPTKG